MLAQRCCCLQTECQTFIAFFKKLVQLCVTFIRKVISLTVTMET